jgi:hypothetical protein
MNLPGYDEWKLRSPEEDRDRYSRRVPDDFSIEYEFDDIEIVEDGVSFGSFNGLAELVLNDHEYGDFYVKHIAIDGAKRERQVVKGYALSIMKRTDAMLLLRMPAKDDQTFTAHLFRKIEAALYASRDAQERFANEMENA